MTEGERCQGHQMMQCILPPAHEGDCQFGKPRPGVMHDIDREFYKLALMERDYWKQVAQR